MKTLTDQLAACGFASLTADGTAQHACGTQVRFGGPDGLTLTLVGGAEKDCTPVTLDFPDELEWFCRRHGLFTPFAQVHAALAPWPGAHPSGDPRHGSVHALTPGGVLGVHDVQSGEMDGTLTLIRGGDHLQVVFHDDDVEREVWIHPANLTGWVPISSSTLVVDLLDAAT